jgi:sigma-B regulation protein RsbU (phosphoserine phosphatase)
MENANGEKFITLFIARFNSQTRELEYINAGHNPPVFFDKSENAIISLSEGCMGIGMFDEIPTINMAKLRVNKGSKLICYTDGIAELENLNKEQFGTQPMAESMVKDHSINYVIDEIIVKLDEYKGTNDYFDDISIMGIEFH